METTIMENTQLYRHEFLTPIVEFISLLGNYGMIWILISIILLIIFKNKKNFLGMQVLVALAITGFVSHLIKLGVQRTRPPHELGDDYSVITVPESYSFPSIHTSLSFTAAIVLHTALPKWRAYIWSLAVFISLSRIYLGVHYPTDLVAGSLIGLAIGMLVMLVFKKFVFPSNSE